MSTLSLSYPRQMLQVGWSALISLVTILCLLSGCNSLFYHPDSVQYGDPFALGYSTEKFFVESAPGVRIEAIHLRAPGKPRGAVVHFHGNAQNMTAHLGFTYWIPERGFDLYVFDYQGYGQSQGTPSREGTIADGRAVLREVLARSKGLPVFVFGQSLGAAVGFVSASDFPPRDICALVFESGFASYRLVVREKISRIWILWWLQYPLSYLVTDDFSPLDVVHKVTSPILFLHGDGDAVVPMAAGRALFERYQGESKKWVEVPGGGHTPAFGNPESPYREVLLEFLSEQSDRCFQLSKDRE